jgi:ABC-type Fe3+-hydroxamate transport system substrate-binding protein
MTHSRRITSLACASLATATLVVTACGTTTPAAPASSTTAPTTSPITSTSAAGSPTSTTAQTVRVRYAEGKVTGDTGRVHVALGSTVALVVTSAVADEVHLHGYDKKVDVPASGTATLTFTATIPGVFEVELERLSKTLVTLEVS